MFRNKKIASIFRVEEYAQKERRINADGMKSFQIKMKATCYSETSKTFNGLHDFISQKIELFALCHISLRIFNFVFYALQTVHNNNNNDNNNNLYK
jgi:hypothetical protein